MYLALTNTTCALCCTPPMLLLLHLDPTTTTTIALEIVPVLCYAMLLALLCTDITASSCSGSSAALQYVPLEGLAHHSVTSVN